jgi:peroxiredoxin Q/BCP
MNKQIAFWIGLVFALSVLLASCSGTTPTPQMEEPESAVSAVTEEPEPTESESAQEPEPTEVVVTEAPGATESMATQEPEPTEIAVTEEPQVIGLSAGEIAPDFSLPDGNGNMVSLKEELVEYEKVVIVFYYNTACPACMAQLSEIENDRAKYEEKGTQVIAIAVQGEQLARTSAKLTDAKFPILADRDHAITDAYGVFESRFYSGSDKDHGLSTPSVFIINQDRQIVWSEISQIKADDCGTERVASKTILENLG